MRKGRSMEKKKNLRKLRLKGSLKSWRKLGLPETTSTIYFGTPPPWVKKLQKIKKK